MSAHPVFECRTGFFGSDSGLILGAPSGIWWTNQSGGMNCAHPTMEGVFVPLPGGVEIIHTEEDCWRGESNTEPASAPLRASVEAYFRRHGLFLRVTDGPGMEAWVPVDVVAPPPGVNVKWMTPQEGLSALVGRKGVFVYGNCD